MDQQRTKEGRPAKAVTCGAEVFELAFEQLAFIAGGTDTSRATLSDFSFPSRIDCSTPK